MSADTRRARVREIFQRSLVGILSVSNDAIYNAVIEDLVNSVMVVVADAEKMAKEEVREDIRLVLEGGYPDND